MNPTAEALARLPYHPRTTGAYMNNSAPFFHLVDYDDEPRQLRLPGPRRLARAVVLPALRARGLEPLAVERTLFVREEGDAEPRPLTDAEADALAADLLADLVTCGLTADQAEAPVLANTLRLAQHQHDTACADQPDHHDRSDLLAYVRAAIPHAWRDAPRFTPATTRKPRSSAPMTPAQRKAAQRARDRQAERDWTAWALETIQADGHQPSLASYPGEVAARIELAQRDWDDVQAEQADYAEALAQYRQDKATARAEKARRAGASFSVGEATKPTHPGPRPQTWAEYAASDGDGMPTSRPRMPSRAVWEAVLAEHRGRPLPTAEEVVARWVAGLPAGRHDLRDLWSAWRATMDGTPKAKGSPADLLGPRQFWKLLGDLRPIEQERNRYRRRFVTIT